jgi:hypothetical protein
MSRLRILQDINRERQRQIELGKSDNHPDIWWFPILSYQLGLISQLISQSVLVQESLATIPGGDDVEIDHDALRVGLIRLCAVAIAWVEQIDE